METVTMTTANDSNITMISNDENNTSSMPIPTGNYTKLEEQNQKTLMKNIIMVSGFIIISLVIAFCIFLYRLSHQKDLASDQQFNDIDDYGYEQSSFTDNMSSILTKNSLFRSEKEFVPMPAIPPKDYSLNVSDLEDHVETTFLNEPFPFRQEYKQIPEGQTAEWKYANSKKSIREKNRFKGIFAYDHSRVPLLKMQDAASQYINANFINGYQEPKRFIATQGPLPSTVNDFWRMCWEYNVAIVVMVTNCSESGRIKSEKYWPPIGNVMRVGMYTIHTIQEELFSNYVIRSLMLKQDETIRKVKHFQFTGWPDHGVPSLPTPLLTLQRKVRDELSTKPKDTGPIVVHCCAGVGRTGTFIALDYLQKQAEVEGIIDVFKYVWEMRLQRVNMVQTWDQYQFIYNLLLEAVTVGNTMILCSQYSKIYADWLIENEETGETKLDVQLRILGILRKHTADIEEKYGVLNVNKRKNRREDIVPSNFYRPYLQTPAEGTTDYINAVFCPGYFKRDTFLITQAPLPHTIVDFWRMVYDFKCSSIICLHNYENEDRNWELLEEEKPEDVSTEEEGQQNDDTYTGDDDSERDEEDKRAPPYWPEKESMSFGPLAITFLKSKTQRDGITITNLTLKMNKDPKIRAINLVSMSEFPYDDNDPLPIISQIALKNAVKEIQKNSINRTVAVMCKYGRDRSGVYCALDYLIDMMEIEEEVNIFQAVRQVQLSRPQLIRNIEQYTLLYETVKYYIELDA